MEAANLTCPKCGAPAKNKAGLSAHLRYKHPEDSPAVTPQTPVETPQAPTETPQAPALTVLGMEGTADPAKPGKPPAEPPLRPSREQIAEGSPVSLVAELLTNLSKALSEWDGAGAEGTFSPLEARQIALLTHNSLITLIERYFLGDVERAKMVFALAVILFGKGRVHFVAIKAKTAKDKAAKAQAQDLPPALALKAREQEQEPDTDTADTGDDWLKALAKAQKEAAHNAG